MHREPTPKAQAGILRQLFAEKGVEMAHRQSLDVVARLHGHASWNVMAALQEPATAESAVKLSGAPAVLTSPKKSPTRRARSVENGPIRCYQFDAIAYVKTRGEMSKLDDVSYTCSPALWASVEEKARELGFTCVGSIGLAEDEEQDDEDIKVFVSVELYGRAKLRENESASDELADILSALCEPMLLDSEGELLAVPSDWEVLSIDSHLETVPNRRLSYGFEAAGIVATRQQLDSLRSTIVANPEVWAQVKAQAEAFGFDSVGNIDLCEDDGGHNTNIKVYVCVRLLGRSYLTTHTPVPTALSQVLHCLTEPLTRQPDGTKAFTPLNWELTVSETISNPLMML